ncbi:MAG: hypothetical protein JSS33_06420 [Proteobacteria bacterium]|nr:hypothetical protein [Pseudomonadota bacterium]
MIPKFLDTTQERAFAESIVAEYDRLRRSAKLHDEKPEKLRQKLGKLSAQIETYNREHKPNIYKKAKLLQSLQDGLKQMGAAPDEIRAFLDIAMTRPLRGPG